MLKLNYSHRLRLFFWQGPEGPVGNRGIRGLQVKKSSELKKSNLFYGLVGFTFLAILGFYFSFSYRIIALAGYEKKYFQ